MRKILAILFILSAFIVNAQVVMPQDESNASLEEIIESIASSSDNENIDFTTLFEDLNYFINNPINLNEATEEQLGKLQFLTDFEIKSILFYVKKSGPMYSIYELQLVFGLPMDKIKLLVPFVTVAPKADDNQFPYKKAFTRGHHQVYVRGERTIEEQKGFSSITDSALAASPNSRYLGDPWRYYGKYKYNYRNRIYWGITFEKDPGEEFFKGSQKNGFDYYSVHLQANNIRLYKDLFTIKTLTLGDFEAQFGQGLVFASGLSYGKTSSVMSVKKRPYGLKRYSGANENQFLRGVGATVRIKNFDITGFVSRKKIDANASVTDTLDNEVIEVSSLQLTGLHTIPSEVADRHALTERISGADVTFNSELFKLGATYVYYDFSAPYVQRWSVNNQFEFTGKSNYNAGANYQFVYNDVQFFGEAATSKNGGMAFLNGFSIKMAPQLSMSVLHRKYQRNYQALYANAFAESSTPANEEGLYFGAEISPIRKWKISTYIDFYKFPWLRYNTSAPAHGHEYFAQIEFAPRSNVSMHFRFKKEESVQAGQPENMFINGSTSTDATRYRYQLSYTITPKLKLKNRFELSRARVGDQNKFGYLIYQDVSYSLTKIPLSLAFRYAIFDTDGWDTKIYAYESDVLYSFSVPAYYDRGIRTYLMAKYTVNKHIDTWFRISTTVYKNKTLIGSGLTEIDKNHKTELTLQVRYKF